LIQKRKSNPNNWLRVPLPEEVGEPQAVAFLLPNPKALHPRQSPMLPKL
jgi:hypothetical protein